MRLIDNWRRAWRLLSVQVAAAAVAWSALPPDVQTAVLGTLGVSPERVPGILGLLVIVAQLREHAGPMRDMRPAEIEACDALIASIAVE